MPDLFIAHQTPAPTPIQPVVTHGTPPAQPIAKPPIQSNHSLTNPFTTFSLSPRGIKFQNQEESEQIILLVRRHVFTNISWIVITLLLSLVPLLTPLLLNVTQLPGLEISFKYIFIFISFYYLLVIGYAFVQFLSWFYNIGIVSNKRIVDIDYMHITYKNVTSTDIPSVVDVEYHQGGFLRTFFNFGDVFIQTEGMRQNIEFHAVPFPAKVADIVLDTKEAFKNAK